MTPKPCGSVVSCGIRTPFGILSPCEGQVTHALLTRPPLEHIKIHPKTSFNMSPLDLHVLGTPPAFVLSQDQTLPFNPFIFSSVLQPTRKKLSRIAVLNDCVCAIFQALLSLYRFQGSALTRSLFIISKNSPFVNTFFNLFSTFFLTFCKDDCIMRVLRVSFGVS